MPPPTLSRELRLSRARLRRAMSRANPRVIPLFRRQRCSEDFAQWSQRPYSRGTNIHGDAHQRTLDGGLDETAQGSGHRRAAPLRPHHACTAPRRCHCLCGEPWSICTERRFRWRWRRRRGEGPTGSGGLGGSSLPPPGGTSGSSGLGGSSSGLNNGASGSSGLSGSSSGVGGSSSGLNNDMPGSSGLGGSSSGSSSNPACGTSASTSCGDR
jgi:hypothetical protein